jgi:hypothetical protein
MVTPDLDYFERRFDRLEDIATRMENAEKAIQQLQEQEANRRGAMKAILGFFGFIGGAILFFGALFGNLFSGRGLPWLHH